MGTPTRHATRRGDLLAGAASVPDAQQQQPPAAQHSRAPTDPAALPLYMPLPGFAKLVGLGTTKTYELVLTGALPSILVGAKRMLDVQGGLAYLQSLRAPTKELPPRAKRRPGEPRARTPRAQQPPGEVAP
jgi:hypothetical protein